MFCRFGTDKRDKTKYNTGPGPGNYNTPQYFGII